MVKAIFLAASNADAVLFFVFDGRDVVTQEDFIAACEKILKEQKSLPEREPGESGNKCDGCPYKRSVPCIGFCISDIVKEMKEKRRECGSFEPEDQNWQEDTRIPSSQTTIGGPLSFLNGKI